MSSPQRLARKPEARTEKVEDLVERVLRGQVRVPTFQRGLKWQASHVLDLFDSLYRGYPVGSLLFQKRSGPAGPIAVGPLQVQSGEVGEAWWVVDGQQRLTSLAVCLGRKDRLPSRPSLRDPYVVFFDPAAQGFKAPPPSGDLPDTWVPAPELLDASRLSDWVHHWRHRDDPELRKTVFEAGKRLREYPLPLYLIDVEDETVAEVIFYRVNQSGVPLQWPEVHDALFSQAGSAPSSLGDLAEELGTLGMGRLSESRLLTALYAFKGLDPTRTFAEHHRKQPEFLRGAVQGALPALRAALGFLRYDAKIPHLQFLPSAILLDVLTAFFGRHPEPSARSRELLARWFWRVLAGAAVSDERTLRRHGIAAVQGDDEEAAIQELLRLVRHDRVRPFELPARLDARADDTRITLLALAEAAPPGTQSETLLKQGRKQLGDPQHRAGLQESVRQLLSRRCAWDSNDRPSIDYLLREGDP